LTFSKGLINRIKRYIWGNPAPSIPISPDMSSVCSKCKIMDLYIKDVEKMHKNEAKHPQVPIQAPDTQRIRRGRHKQ